MLQRAALGKHQSPFCPPPPPPRVQEPPCARTAPWFRGRIFHITFFCQGKGFFMVSGGCGTAIQVCRTTFHVCCYGSPHQVGPYQSVTLAHTP